MRRQIDDTQSCIISMIGEHLFWIIRFNYQRLNCQNPWNETSGIVEHNIVLEQCAYLHKPNKMRFIIPDDPKVLKLIGKPLDLNSETSFYQNNIPLLIYLSEFRITIIVKDKFKFMKTIVTNAFFLQSIFNEIPFKLIFNPWLKLNNENFHNFCFPWVYYLTAFLLSNRFFYASVHMIFLNYSTLLYDV